MLTTLRRTTLAQQAAQHLLDHIEQQEMKPGDFLPSEGQLATQFGVSRPIIREALRVLEAKDIVTVVNGKGAMVKPLTNELLSMFFQRVARNRQGALVELMEVRRGIETQSAWLAAQRRTGDDVREMTDVVAGMGRHLQDPQHFVKLDAQFHLLVARAGKNLMLYHLVESIREPLEDTIREGLQHRTTQEQFERVQSLHEQLAAAIAAADPEAAVAAMTRHFDDALMAMVQDDEVGEVVDL
jgi:DNA-binding FadR family transcriptional regulator